MALQVLDIKQAAAEVLEDRQYVTYLEEHHLRWVNDAQRTLALVRPDALSSIQNFSLAPSLSRQTLPATVARLGGLLRNMGADGATPGRAIVGPSPREPMDATDPLWSTRTGEYVRTYVYDEETPRDFYVYPVVSGTWVVEAKLFLVPTELTDENDALQAGDVYAAPLREWVLYNCYARDSERTPNYVRASRHFANFFQLLGIKVRADLAVSPKILEHGKQLEVRQ
ncbi:MAG: hypothetical protein K2Y51_26010 [Gammaproteobacteria bacterium]|nr:hypothetical protein [Gammaproteobacteria bacterium]